MNTKKINLRLPINSLCLFKFASFQSKNKNDLKNSFFLYFFGAFFSSPFFNFVVPGLLVVLLVIPELFVVPSLALWRLSLLPRTFSRLPVLAIPVDLVADLDAAEPGRSGDPRDEVLLGLEGIPEDTRGEVPSEESSSDPVLPSDVWLSDFLTLDTPLGLFVEGDFSAVPFKFVPLL